MSEAARSDLETLEALKLEVAIALRDTRMRLEGVGSVGSEKALTADEYLQQIGSKALLKSDQVSPELKALILQELSMDEEPEDDTPEGYELSEGGKKECYEMLVRMAGTVNEQISKQDLRRLVDLIFARNLEDYCPTPREIDSKFVSLIANGVGLQNPMGFVALQLKYKKTMGI